MSAVSDASVFTVGAIVVGIEVGALLGAYVSPALVGPNVVGDPVGSLVGANVVGTAVVGSAVNVITETGATEFMMPGSAFVSPEDTELLSPDVDTVEAPDGSLDTAVLDTR